MSCSAPKLPPEATTPALPDNAPGLVAFARRFPNLEAFRAHLVESNAVLSLDRDAYRSAAYELLNGKPPEDRHIFLPRELDYPELVNAWFEANIIQGRGGYDPDDPAVLAFLNRHYGYYSLRTGPALERAGFKYVKSRKAWTRKAKPAPKPEVPLAIDPAAWERIVMNPDYFASSALTGAKIQIISRTTGRPLCGKNAPLNCDDWSENASDLAAYQPTDKLCAACVRIAISRL